MHEWRVRQTRRALQLEAMPAGIERGMVESLMQTRVIAAMDVLAGFKAPLFVTRNGVFPDVGMVPPGTTVDLTSSSAWLWTADDGFKEII